MSREPTALPTERLILEPTGRGHATGLWTAIESSLPELDELWRSCNLGYWIRTDLSGRGLTTEAGRAVLDFAFDRLDLNRVELVAATDNVASQRVAEKLGFRFEGTKREGTFVNGRGVDVHMYGLLASDPRD